MPMTWNAEADAKLFAAILRIHDVKLDLPKIAEAMGPDCTAKALSHRIAKIKKDAASISTASSSATPASASPKKRAAVSTPGKSTAKKAKKPTGQHEEGTRADHDEGDDSDSPLDGPASPSLGRSGLHRSAGADIKRAHSDESEEDEVKTKRVKCERREDSGVPV